MELDRRRFDCDPSFTQLFVSRSSRLCKYVNEIVGDGSGRFSDSFTTFNVLIYQIESLLSRGENHLRFIRSRCVDFYRFSRDFYNQESTTNAKLNALLVWKSECQITMLFLFRGFYLVY